MKKKEEWFSFRTDLSLSLSFLSFLLIRSVWDSLPRPLYRKKKQKQNETKQQDKKAITEEEEEQEEEEEEEKNSF